MNNDNFEQQFSQKVKATMPPAPAAPVVATGGSSLPLIVAIVLGVITLLESVVLIFTLINYFQLANPGEVETVPEAEYIEGGDDGLSGYDDSGNLIWLNLTCTNKESGNKFVLTKSNKYQYYTGSTISESGDYAIVNDNLVSLSGSNSSKVIYYDGYSLADSLTLYDCDFDVETTSNTEE